MSNVGFFLFFFSNLFICVKKKKKHAHTGEHPAAMHHGLSPRCSTPDAFLLLVSLTITFCFYQRIRWKNYPTQMLFNT